MEIETSIYNERRYGKPWIAVVSFTESKKGDFNFGDWVGEPGYEGLLILDVKPGDIVAKGQKDTRKPRNSAPAFYQVQDDGSLGDEISKVNAFKAWRVIDQGELA